MWGVMGGQTQLRPAVDDDLAVLSELRNDTELQLMLMARPRPNTLSQVRAWVERRSSDASSALFVIADATTGSAVGFLQLTDIDDVNRVGRLGIGVVRAQQGRGHGGRALQSIEPLARDVFGLRKITLEVRADNLAAISLYERSGYERVGLWRDHFRLAAKWVDVVAMERFLAPDGTADVTSPEPEQPGPTR
jgi:RimJ/RimL family protein N-acetyltransferase